MGEVRRVRDHRLNRTLAMKLVHASVLGRPAAMARFLEEAQATAQLQHPNIVPVHDLGVLPDGRVWFTMKEIRGRTLREVVAEVHAASSKQWEAGASGWTFRRVIGAFHAVCNAVAHAHERGVVHRDLKPDNVMVGVHGEVYVLDWGLAKIVGAPDAVDEVRTERSSSEDHQTQVGQVAGTPAYMPPEQARGLIDRIDARSDVYALGAILYEILSGRAPYEGTAHAVLGQVLAGPPVAVGPAAAATTYTFGFTDEPHAAPVGPPLPDELVAACERAMARDPADRFASASLLADAILDWIDGSHRRDQALEVTRRALAQVGEVDALRTAARAARDESAALLRGLAGWQPEEDKAPGWARLAEAESLDRAASLKDLEVDHQLHGALQIAPDLPDAHAALASRYRARHAEAEARRDEARRIEAEALLGAHAAALPDAHDTRREMAAYLKGHGALTVLTDPPGAEVLLYRTELQNRRLVEVFDRSLGPSPVHASSLPMGSWSCRIRHPGRADVCYPVEITRQGHWDGVPPGAREPVPVWLPPADWLGPDEVYVPAGWFRAGGDPDPAASLPAMRLWCDAFVMRRFPVTNAEYIPFLDDLVAQGREAEALAYAPREQASAEDVQGALIYRYAAGRFSLQRDSDGDLWDPQYPVVLIDLHGALAWLAWHAARSGRPWRLPLELEWEKAARGVDGRFYPWGDWLDPSWCRMTDSHRPGKRLPAPVDTYPVDCSPYGVRGMAGNVQERCADVHGPPTVVGDRVVEPTAPVDPTARARYVNRGGAWDVGARTARSSMRYATYPSRRNSSLGLRGVWRVP